MPREIPVAVTPARVRLPVRACVLFLLCAASASAIAGRLTVAIDIAQGKWKTVHLKNMPKDTPVAVQIESSGDIRVTFVRMDAARQPPDAVTPEFQGKVERSLSFGVTIPRAGDYLLILDNRKSDGARKVNLLIRADKPGAVDPPARVPPGKGTETRI